MPSCLLSMINPCQSSTCGTSVFPAMCCLARMLAAHNYHRISACRRTSAIRHMMHHDERRVNCSLPVMVLLVRLKNGLDGQAKQPRNLERQWQAGVVFAGFQRVDGLARDLQVVG